MAAEGRLRPSAVGQLRTVEVGILQRPFERALDPREQPRCDLRCLVCGIDQHVGDDDMRRIGRLPQPTLIASGGPNVFDYLLASCSLSTPPRIEGRSLHGAGFYSISYPVLS